MIVPVVVLALAWDSRLVLFDVPLIGDHQTSEAGKLVVQVIHTYHAHVKPLRFSHLCLDIDLCWFQ